MTRIATALCAALLLAWPAASMAQNCEFPGVLLVLDRSTSMLDRIDGARKWDIAADAMAALLQQHGNAAHFGLMLYPGPSGSGANGVEGPVGACRYNLQDAGCTPERPRCTTGEVVVDLGANTRNRIVDALQWPANLSHSYTPTWQSLEAARRHPALRNPNRRDFVVLVTDGWQCCGLYIDGNGAQRCEAEDRNLVVQRIEALRNDGITPFVVGFGGSVDVETLQRSAVAAGTARAGCDPNHRGLDGDRHCYYQASNHQQLAAMLDDIVRRIGEELCDGRDNDCDGAVDEGLTRPCNGACGPGEEACFNGVWGACSSPGARPESCNGADDDCDGRTDEGLQRPCNNACGLGTEFCRLGQWTDCDAPPVNPEVCNGIDDDCDGAVDPGCECEPGDARPCGDDVGACRTGTQRCLPDGTWSEVCEGGVGPQPEACNGIDDDCDGRVDGLARDCQTACGGGREVCEQGRWGGCDAPEPGDEVCNGVDDDCDGRTDEGLSRMCTSACGSGTETCQGGRFGDCTARQPVEEVCGNGVDDDCDGRTDEGCGCADGDTQPCGTDQGECTAGEQRCVGGAWGDCEGATDGGEEVCNGLDDDCDGRTDEGELCDPGQVCGCGACADPCENNECGGNAQCIFGHCISDNCPEGYVCQDGVCVGGENPDDGQGPGTIGLPDAGGGRGDGGRGNDGCACDAGGGGAPGPVALLALLAAAGLRRRRRS